MGREREFELTMPGSRLKAETDRILGSDDFPEVCLSKEQRSTLAGINLTHVVLDHDKPDLAAIQADLAAKTWGSCLHNLSVVYATNGDTSIVSERPVEIIKRPSLPNRLGVPDLVATSVKEISPHCQDRCDWISFASADVWILNPTAWLRYLSDAAQQGKQVVTSYCGGLGMRGFLRYSDYYFSRDVFGSTFRATGLMTEFFAIRSDLAARSLAYWNNPQAGRLCYKNFHNDPRSAKYVERGSGTVEAHFRYLLAKIMGKEFDSGVALMHVCPPDLLAYPRVYPCGMGYTSTHNDRVRVRNVEIAGRYNPGVVSFSSMDRWLGDHQDKIDISTQ
jgi:hypothetical protein